MAGQKTLKPVPVETGQGIRGRILEAAFSAFAERGFAETSTLAIATRARVSKRELYALFGNKQEMLIACISARAGRLRLRTDLPELAERETLRQTLVAFGGNLLREISEPAVLAMFRLAIAEALRAPEIAQALSDIGIAASRDALREIMRRACSAGLAGGEPDEMAGQFYGLLWGNRMIGLLLATLERPSSREIARLAEHATEAFMRLYPPKR